MADLLLQNLVATRLAEAPPNVDGANNLVLAAFQGPDALRATLHGHEAGSIAATQPDQAPTATYLAAIEVEGFRGIGPPVTLTLEPSPGLTLVVGRNGSGKSSFAEALEMLLTGSNRRWTERAKVWQDGWRNLHHGPPRISGRFRPDGGRKNRSIERRRAHDHDHRAPLGERRRRRRLHPHHRRQATRPGGERLEPCPGELATPSLSQRAGTDPGGAPLRAVRRPGEDTRARGDRGGRDPAPRDPARRRAPDPRPGGAGREAPGAAGRPRRRARPQRRRCTPPETLGPPGGGKRALDQPGRGRGAERPDPAAGAEIGRAHV